MGDDYLTMSSVHCSSPREKEAIFFRMFFVRFIHSLAFPRWNGNKNLSPRVLYHARETGLIAGAYFFQLCKSINLEERMIPQHNLTDDVAPAPNLDLFPAVPGLGFASRVHSASP